MTVARMYTFCNDQGRKGSGLEVCDTPRTDRAKQRNDTEVFDARWVILEQQKWCHAAARAEFSMKFNVLPPRQLNLHIFTYF